MTRSVASRNPWPAVSYLRDILVLFAAITASLWFLVTPALFDLWYPIPYSGDVMSHGFLVKTIIETGWYPSHNPNVGAPFGSDLFDYPFSDGLNFLIIRFLSIFSSDWVVVVNLFFLAGYYLSGATAYVVLRRLGVASQWAIAGALLFALLPYHLMRRAHLLLASYAVVPLGVWLAFMASRGAMPDRPFRKTLPGPAALVLAVGSGGVYYAFFSAMLVAVAGLARVLATRRIRDVLPALLLVAGLSVTVLLNVAPSLVQSMRYGANPEVATRPATDSEEVPGRASRKCCSRTEHHRIPAMRDLAERYAYEAPSINENVSASLGSQAPQAFLLLVLVALRRVAGAPQGSATLALLAALALASFAFGTVGGGGAVFAYLISPMVRGYNRISVVIAFISLAGLVIALQALFGRVRALSTRSAATAGAVVLALLGVLDQTPPRYWEWREASFVSDRRFVRDAESKLSPGTMVLQLPYQPFPESEAVEQMRNYGPLRGYLYSTGLRWSYGAMKGRQGDRWLQALMGRALDDQIVLAARRADRRRVRRSSGLRRPRRGHRRVLREQLGPPLAQSVDGHLVMYRLTPTGDRPLAFDEVLVPIDSPIRFDRRTLTPLVARDEGLSGYEAFGKMVVGSSSASHAGP